MTQPACRPGGAMRLRRIGVLLLVAMFMSQNALSTAAAPGSGASLADHRRDIPDGKGSLAVVVPVVALQGATLSIACLTSVSSGEAMPFTLSGSGMAIIDAGEGYFPVERPNTDFDPESDGDATMVGTGPGDGTIELVWIAPVVEAPRTVYLFASNEAGETPGECAIEVRVAADRDSDSPSSADAEVGSVGGQTNIQDADATTESQPTPTEAPTKPTKTPVPYDEVRGLPTNVAVGTHAPDEGGGTAADTPAPTATVRQNATFAPTISEEGMVATIIGPEGGVLPCPAGAEIEVPPGALKEPSTVTIVPISNSKLPVQNAVELIPDTGFDVTFAGPDGRAIDYALLEKAEFHIKLDEEAIRTGTKLYLVDGAALVPLSGTRIDGETLSVSIDGYARLVAGIPAPVNAGTTRNVGRYVAAAAVGVIAMIVMVVLFGMFRPRRHRIITNRRTTRSRY